MASMYKRNGVWYAKWYEHGKPRRKSLKTRSVQRARVKLVEIEQDIEQGRPVGHIKDALVDEFTTAYLSHIKATKRPYTVKKLEHVWKTFTKWAKPVRLSDITPTVIQEYKVHRLREGYKKSTVRASLLAISGTFSTAMKEMHCFDGNNPVKGVGLPKADKAFPRYMELEQIEKLLETAEAHSADMHLLMAIGVFAGLRKNELINARWGWIDWKGRGRILVQSRGRFQTKSGDARMVPMSKRLRPILEAHRVDDPDAFIVYPEQPEKDGSETKYRVDFTEAFATVCETAGVGWVTPHKLRHTFASQRAIAGVSLYKIQKWLGHSDPKTTMVYAHLSSEHDDDID